MSQLHEKLGRMQGDFQVWEHSVFGSVKQELKLLSKDLEDE